MLQEPIVFAGIWFISLIMGSFLFSNRAGVLRPIALRLFFIGVIFHELAHYTMCLAVGKIPKKISIKWRDEKFHYFRNPHGKVDPSENYSFLQAVVVALAPLYISTWIIFGLTFGIVFTPFYNPIIKTICVFVILSLLLTASPSTGDIGYIGAMYRKDPKHSWYQILLIIISIPVLWLFLVITQITFIWEFFYYVAIGVIYNFLRYSLIGIRKLTYRITHYDFRKPQKFHAKNYTRRRYKPTKPWKDQGGN
jgi:hypothetical protein